MANKDQHSKPRSRRASATHRPRRRPPGRAGAAPAAAAPQSGVSFNPFSEFPPAPPPEANPQDLEPREVLFGGRPYTVRPLHPDDEGRLISFFASHTEETIRQRYGYHISEMTHDRASRLVGVDQSQDVAYGVFERAPDGAEILHAVGRYLLDPARQTAEMAFVVRETKRHLGICTTLLRLLLRAARHRGMRYLYAQVQADNIPMRSIFRRHGGRIKPILGADAVEVFLPTAPP
jgi:RimJ/RimL family protein N-acetyltransferase